MDNSLKIGKYIKLILERNENVNRLVPSNRIWALCAPDNPKYPFIVYSRSSLIVNYNKDVYMNQKCLNDVQVTIDCHGKTYTESVEVANMVRNALEYTQVRNDEITIDTFKLVGSSELTDGEGDYTQILVFSTTIQ